MAKEEKDKKEKKKKGGCLSGCLVGILIIVIIIVLIAAFIFAIFETILGIIKQVIWNIVNAIFEFLADPITWVMKEAGALKNYFSKRINGTFDPYEYELGQPRQLVEISQDEFKVMKNSLENSSISREAIGLDDLMLKKMLLAWNTGNYSHNADIIIEVTKEEYESYEPGEEDKITKKQGRDIDQISMNWTDHVKNFFDMDSSKAKYEEKQDKYYLCTTGVLTFVNEENEELVYYSEEVLKTIFINEFQVNRYGSHSGYAESVWEYLSSNCYTDGKKGMQMYSKQKIEEELIEWSFDDTDNQWYNFSDYKMIRKQIVRDEYLLHSSEWAKECEYRNCSSSRCFGARCRYC